MAAAGNAALLWQRAVRCGCSLQKHSPKFSGVTLVHRPAEAESDGASARSLEAGGARQPQLNQEDPP